MTAAADSSSGTHTDLFGASQSLASTTQIAHSLSILKPENLKGLDTVMSTVARALELSPQSLVATETLSALATWNRAVMSISQPVLSESARQAMTRSVAAAAGLDAFSTNNTALTTALLKDYEPMRAALTSLQDSVVRLTRPMIPDESLTAIASALASINVSIEASTATATAQAVTKQLMSNGSYEQVARQLVGSLGIANDQELPSHAFDIDAAASSASYDLICKHAPEIATQIDEAADRVTTSFLGRSWVRYSMAGLVLTLIITAWVLTTPNIDIIPQPWRSVLRSSVEGAAVGVPATLVIARKPGKSNRSDHTGTDTEEMKRE
ncbi:hypothetical protein [Actinomyces sp. W5033]|uniref:hypothetical protein n=1 Tax=Actinomyces sp. W5033 TaxID=3446479 RepID=UPI003EE3AE38